MLEALVEMVGAVLEMLVAMAKVIATPISRAKRG